MTGSVARRPKLVIAVIAVVVALALGYGSMRDALNPVLAGAQGCPGLIAGANFAFNDGCPPDVHPWLLP
jgi:hypothetical protein